MRAYFDRFTIELTAAQARSASHRGRCDEDVDALLRAPNIAPQLAALNPELVRAELEEYGAWDPTELSNPVDNLRRVVWIACCNVLDL
jgi:hypothetical protein